MTSRRQKYRFHHFCLGSVCLDIFLKLFSCMQGQYQYTQKCLFKNLQFLAVTYDMEVLICAFDVIKTDVFFSFVF